MQKVERNSKTTVHIGNLSSDITEDIFISFFIQFGEIKNFKLAGDSSYSVRFGFIEYSNENEVNDVLKVSGFEFYNKKLKISISKSKISSKQEPLRLQQLINYCKIYTPHLYINNSLENRTIKISNFDHTFPNDYLIYYFSNFGIITNYKRIKNTSLLIEYLNLQSCSVVLSLNGMQFGNNILNIELSKEKILKSDIEELLKKTIHIKNLKNVEENEVKCYFEKICGSITKIVFNENQFFCFIEFESIDSIKKALDLSNTIFRQNKIKVEKAKTPIFPSQIIEKKRKRENEEVENLKKITNILQNEIIM
eukprot:gene12209-5796_t